MRLRLGTALAAGLLWWFGRGTWSAYQEYRLASQVAEQGVPIGYVGVSLRRTYKDKPLRFFDTTGGRKRLWAAKGADGLPEFYDVTDAAFAVEKVSGGYGRDSIPGIDYPLFEQPDSPRARHFRASHEVFGLDLPEGARGYPRDLLRKIEVVNDDGARPVRHRLRPTARGRPDSTIAALTAARSRSGPPATPSVTATIPSWASPCSTIARPGAYGCPRRGPWSASTAR